MSSSVWTQAPMFFCDPLRHRPACGESASDLARRVASDSSSVLSSLTCFLRRARHSLSDSSVFFSGFFLAFRFFSTMAAPDYAAAIVPRASSQRHRRFLYLGRWVSPRKRGSVLR